MQEIPTNTSQEDTTSAEIISGSNDVEKNQIERSSFGFSKRLRFGGLRYGITSLSSVASGFTLEAICVPTGVAAATMNPLKEVSFEAALGILGVSYVAWGYGIWTNYNQVWKALQEVGVGTSVWAKVGYDLSTAATSRDFFKKMPAVSEFLKRGSTLIGFTALELAKELPYYAVAFGGKLAIEQLDLNLYTPNMEISFLAGANLAAALFNSVQAVGIAEALRVYRGRDEILPNAKSFVFSKFKKRNSKQID